MTTPTLETLVSAREIATQCGKDVNPRAILRWAKAGRIPSIRINARVIKFDPVKVREALRKLNS